MKNKHLFGLKILISHFSYVSFNYFNTIVTLRPPSAISDYIPAWLRITGHI